MAILLLGEHAISDEHIVAMKDAGGGKTTVWTVGQSAVDGGFLVDCPFDEAFKLWTGGDDADETEEEEEDEELPAGEAAGSGDEGGEA
jgi:hypothetical protein